MRNLLVRGALALCLSAVVALMVRAEAPRQLIIIDTTRMSLTLYENQREVRRFGIAVGAYSTPSPLGTFIIDRRFIPEEFGAFGSRFLGLNVPWGNYAIHGTDQPGSIGNYASHGCFRMHKGDIETLYRLVSIGTPVIVESGPYGELGRSLSTLRPGDRSSAVRAVQRKLHALNYYAGNPDGVFGAGTIAALREFLRDAGLPWQERVDETVYAALGLMLFE
jgi:hypothetical protein